MKKGHQIKPERISRGLRFQYIASSATRLSTHITISVDNVFLTLLALLLFARHYCIFSNTHFFSLAFQDSLLHRHIGTKKVSRGTLAWKQNILHLIFITLFIQYSWWIQVNNVTSAVVQRDVQGMQEWTKSCCCPRVSQSCTASLPAEEEGTN